MNDDSLYTLVRTEFDQVHLPQPVDAVTARGRSLRRRRRGFAAAGVTLALAFSGGLALTLPHHEPPSKVRLAAWSVDPKPDGEVVLTVRQLLDADKLTAALKRAGVPALVEFKTYDPATTRVLGCVDNQPYLPEGNDVIPSDLARQDGSERMYTILRSEMPPGTSLHVIVFEEKGPNGPASRMVMTGLVKGTPLPCELLQ